ncbi:pilus assembly protein Flp/PilA [Arthrobacter silviterrae]|uniref:Flp family type IVb pilin n=1 Tax=Arthrobacter silviterrae TaxID=2026658 RepID=A0ABX0DD72_9MICC|nr:Flp family type IVb pilin [Arthrobacter silviterrae]MDQ0278860.1 pilus assembly protein Flp/PilA [Arthrobacter silviterrae]NGN84844.1 Flp family type IVb pilin [Arthrobacter silviterrae]
MLPLFLTLQSFLTATKRRLNREESGATAVEYGLLVGLIAVAIVAALVLLGPKLATLFTNVTAAIPAG